MKYFLALTLVLSLIFLSCGVSKTGIVKSDETDKTFSKKDNIKMDFVSGDCQISKSSDNLIHVRVIQNIDPDKNFEPLMEEKENTLELKEIFHGSSKGDVKWVLSVPSGININFKAASGNLSIENLKTELKVSVASGNIKIENTEGDFHISTASGNVTAKNSNGNFKISTASGELKAINSEGKLNLSTASGNITVENSKGLMQLNSASGKVTATGVSFTDKCSFNSATGNINVKLSESPKNDISLNSATGNAILDFNGNSMSGYIKLSVRKNKGDIKAPFQFDSEEEITRSNDGIYLVKTIKINSDSPKISISSSSGIAEIIK